MDTQRRGQFRLSCRLSSAPGSFTRHRRAKGEGGGAWTVSETEALLHCSVCIYVCVSAERVRLLCTVDEGVQL